MSDEQIRKDLESGKKKIVNKWEYLFNQWSPIVTIVGFLVAGIFWFANAESRMFTTPEIRTQAEDHIKDNKNLDDIYIRKDQYEQQTEDLKEDLKEIQRDIKELLKRR